jgi:membrane protease YdiL (CAAX protease family)
LHWEGRDVIFATIKEVLLWLLRLLVWSVAAAVPLVWPYGEVVSACWMLGCFLAFLGLVIWPRDPARRAASVKIARLQRPLGDVRWLVASGFAAMVLSISLAVTVVALGVPANTPAYLQASLLRPTVTTVFLFAVGGPFVEEYIFRGRILPALSPLTGARMAVVVSALLFAAVHFNWAGFPSELTIGLVAGTVLLVTRSLWSAVAIHALNNSTAVIGSAFAGATQGERALAQSEGTLAALPLALASAVVLVYALRRLKASVPVVAG